MVDMFNQLSQVLMAESSMRRKVVHQKCSHEIIMTLFNFFLLTFFSFVSCSWFVSSHLTQTNWRRRHLPLLPGRCICLRPFFDILCVGITRDMLCYDRLVRAALLGCVWGIARGKCSWKPLQFYVQNRKTQHSFTAHNQIMFPLLANSTLVWSND